tara:strand:- start:179 stop:1189 length:1011 start_codon:yes stop_codon:yes gene_type:complete
MNIALDIMSGDHGPLSNIKGAIKYIKNPLSKDNIIFLYGNENIFKNNKSLLEKYNKRIKTVLTKEIITMDDKPSFAYRNKRNSSLIKTIDDLKNQTVDAAVSSGNTGALLTSSLLILGKIVGIRRPALAPYIPLKKSGFILCDAGANSNVKPEHLVQFALMSSAYLEHMGEILKPRIALLNIGSEETKGNALTVSAYPLLKEKVSNFIGNIESRELFNNKADIVLCDGFTGNIVLKLIEGIIQNMINITLESIDSHTISKLIKPILSPVFNDITKTFDYEEYGGTPILGVNGIVMKCHGSSNSKTIENALLKSQTSYENHLITDLENILNKNEILV